MTKMKVIKDRNGKIINIGPWDYVEMEEDSGKVDELGNPIIHIVQTNPFPEGAVESEADIITGWDGGLYEVGDPRAKAH